MIKLCIVTEFEQENFFQWTVALRRVPQYQVASVVMNPETLSIYNNKSSYWNPIRKADIVFVYCVRHNMKWKWYNIPFEVRKFMREDAKMICQFDLEFLWLFHPEHFPWKKIDPWSKGKTPKEFFDETGVLEVADAYIIFFNLELKNFTSKPVFNIPLPQLVRYQSFLISEPSNNDFLSKSRRMAIIHHSVKSAKIDLDLIKFSKAKYPVSLFTCRQINSMEKLELIKDLPSRGKSRVYGQVDRKSYMEFLEKCYVAIDDNEGYYGWSRFAMECALANVPCIGSTIAVKTFFPRLYTRHKEYRKQRKLLKRLYEDPDFWLEIAKEGKKNVVKKMEESFLVEKFNHMINEVKSLPTQKITSVKPKTKKRDVEKEYREYKKFLDKHFPKKIPHRPNKGELVNDPILREFLNQEMWDSFYAKWLPFLEGKRPDYDVCSETLIEDDSDEINITKTKEYIEEKETEVVSDIEKTLSIVVAVRNRGLGDSEVRVRNFFNSLTTQTDKDFELVIIDYGSEKKYREKILNYCLKHNFSYYYIPSKEWNSPRAINIGVLKAKGNYIVQTNIDMIFRKDFISQLKKKLSSKAFIWTVPTFLNEKSYSVLDDISFPEGYSKLTNYKYWWTTWEGKALGAIQCVSRKWFIRVNGYDERMTPYGPCETDLWSRASRDGLEMICLEERNEAELAICCHQWHKKSEHFVEVRESGRIFMFRDYLDKAEESNIIVKEGWNTFLALRNECSNTFSVVLLVSRCNENLEKCVDSILKQSPDEIRVYIDPLKLNDKQIEKVYKLLEGSNAKILMQTLTSDSDEEKNREEQKKAATKVRHIGGQIHKWKRDIAKKHEAMGKKWNIHHSAHSDCVRNVHRSVMEAENKWVVRMDDDDELAFNVREVLEKCVGPNVGIICGDRQFKKKNSVYYHRGSPVEKARDSNKIRGSITILNRDAFIEVHSNMSHKPWQDFRRWYWIIRGGYKVKHISKIFSIVNYNDNRDPRRLAEGGGITWLSIANDLDKKPVVLDI